MNDFHSSNELIYKKRLIAEQVRSAVAKFPVVVISGARQVGKSTMLQNEFADFKYVSLDDYATLRQANEDPASLWINTDKIIIDEAQKASEVFTAIKLAVDKSKRQKRFILSGSSNLLLMNEITESLAGRAIYFEILPMSFGEITGDCKAQERFLSLWQKDLQLAEQVADFINPLPYMLRGFMPPIMSLQDLKDAILWWEGYLKTYVERDVRELSQIESLIDFRRVLDSLAIRTGNILNQTEIARDTGVSQPTVYRYLKLIEVLNIIKRIPAYAQNRTKRITKSPKVFFVDPALSVYLSGYHDEETLSSAREVGAFFETMLFLHLNVFAELMVPKAKIFYWRTTTGKEVDFVIEQGKKLLAIEVKFSQNPSFNDIKNLLSFMQDYPHTLRGILIHAGNEIKWLHSKVIALPWWWIC